MPLGSKGPTSPETERDRKGSVEKDKKGSLLKETQRHTNLKETFQRTQSDGTRGYWGLTVATSRASGLVAKDNKTGTSSPYVKVETAGVEHKTKVKENSTSPVWNDIFKIDIPPNVQTPTFLSFTLYHWSVSKGFAETDAEFLGFLKIELTALMEAAKQAGEREPNLPFEKKEWYPLLKLKDTDKVSGELEIGIEIITPELARKRALAQDNRLSVLKLTNGVHQFSSPESADTDVVLVCGIGQDPVHTWLTRSGSALWPQQWLGQDAPTARVITLEILSRESLISGVEAGNTTFLQDRAFDLLAKLTTPHINIGASKRPIVWLAHSTGGLVVKQMLLEARKSDDYRHVCQQTKVVVFYGCGHKGSNLAKILSADPEIPVEVNVRDLLCFDTPEKCRPHCFFHSKLDREFIKMVRTGGAESPTEEGWIKVLNYAESKPSELHGQRMFVVEKDSSRPEYGTWVPAEVNHFELTRPTDQMDILYVKTSQLVQDVVKQAQAMGTGSPIISSSSSNFASQSSFNSSAALRDPNSTASSLIATAPTAISAAGALPSYSDRVSAEEMGRLNFQIGYEGSITRVEAERKLQSRPIGTYLTRWSQNNNTYVLSYVKDTKAPYFEHIANIFKVAEGSPEVIVHTLKGPERFKSLHEFIFTMRENGIITEPVGETAYATTTI